MVGSALVVVMETEVPEAVDRVAFCAGIREGCLNSLKVTEVRMHDGTLPHPTRNVLQVRVDASSTASLDGQQMYTVRMQHVDGEGRNQPFTPNTSIAELLPNVATHVAMQMADAASYPWICRAHGHLGDVRHPSLQNTVDLAVSIMRGRKPPPWMLFHAGRGSHQQLAVSAERMRRQAEQRASELFWISAAELYVLAGQAEEAEQVLRDGLQSLPEERQPKLRARLLGRRLMREERREIVATLVWLGYCRGAWLRRTPQLEATVAACSDYLESKGIAIDRSGKGSISQSVVESLGGEAEETLRTLEIVGRNLNFSKKSGGFGAAPERLRQSYEVLLAVSTPAELNGLLRSLGWFSRWRFPPRALAWLRRVRAQTPALQGVPWDGKLEVVPG